MNLGNILRSRRKEKGFTLKELSTKTNLSEGFLSQVENNVKSMSIPNLMKVCDALDAEIDPIFNELKNRQSLFVFPKKDWGDIDIPHTGFATRRLSPPESRSVIDSAVIILEPGKSIPVRKNIKNSQEVISVLQGRLELIHADETITLAEGDSVHFWTEMKDQSITNIGAKDAIIIWVGTL